MISTTNKKLILFDIDGTLITTASAGEQAFRDAFLECFNIVDDLSKIDFSGTTDSYIIEQLFINHSMELTEVKRAEFQKVYLRYLKRNLPLKPGYVMPGVIAILEELKRDSRFVIGLLTGNFKEASKLKLQHYKLASYFDFELGAFADDSPQRNELGPVVLKRAQTRVGMQNFSTPFEDILIIGDTPRDVACARALGAKVLAVATGRYTMEMLKPSKADFLVENLDSERAREICLYKDSIFTTA